MATARVSVTVDRSVYEQFESARARMGANRSAAVEEAIKLWLKQLDEALISEGCIREREEDLALARASKQKAAHGYSLPT